MHYSGTFAKQKEETNENDHFQNVFDTYKHSFHLAFAPQFQWNVAGLLTRV